MANVKISALPAATTIGGADLIPIVQGGVTKQATPDTLPLGAAQAASIATAYLSKRPATAAPTLADVQAITGLRWCFTPDTGFYSDQAGTTRQTTDGGAVKCWKDAGPNQDHATTATSGLTLKQAGPGALNVGGVAAGLATTGTFDGSFNNGYTVFTVAADPTLPDNRVAWSSLDGRLYLARNGATGQNNQGITLSGWSYNAPFIPVEVPSALNTTGFLPGVEVEAWRHNGQGNPIDTWYSGYWGEPNAAAPATAPAITGKLVVGAYGQAAGFEWRGTIQAVVIFNRTLTDTEVATVYGYLADTCRVNQRTLVHCIGNSLTAGTNASTGVNAIPGLPRLGYAKTGGKDWPSQVLDAIGPEVAIRVDAVPGRATPQIIADMPKSVQPFRTAGGGKRIALIWEVTNDLATNITTQFPQILAGQTPDSYTNLVTACQALKSQGWTVGVFTCLPRGDLAVGTQNAQFYAAFQVVNRLIRRNWAGYADFLVDVAGDPRLGAVGAEQSATYFGADHTHLTDAGYTLVANMVRRALNQVL